MPSTKVKKHGVERTFEQVLRALYARVKPLFSVASLPDKDGWTIEDDLSALQAMIADRAALLEERVATLELEQGRLTEQLSQDAR